MATIKKASPSFKVINVLFKLISTFYWFTIRKSEEFVCKHSCLGVPAKWPKQKMRHVFILAAMQKEGDYWICNLWQKSSFLLSKGKKWPKLKIKHVHLAGIQEESDWAEMFPFMK